MQPTRRQRRRVAAHSLASTESEALATIHLARLVGPPICGIQSSLRKDAKKKPETRFDRLRVLPLLHVEQSGNYSEWLEVEMLGFVLVGTKLSLMVKAPL